MILLHAFAATFVLLVKGAFAAVGGVLAVATFIGLLIFIIAACVADLLNPRGVR